MEKGFELIADALNNIADAIDGFTAEQAKMVDCMDRVIATLNTSEIHVACEVCSYVDTLGFVKPLIVSMQEMEDMNATAKKILASNNKRNSILESIDGNVGDVAYKPRPII